MQRGGIGISAISRIAGIGFLFGIAAASYYFTDEHSVAFLIIICAIASYLFLRSRYKLAFAISLFCYAVCFILAIFWYQASLPGTDSISNIEGKYSIEATVKDRQKRDSGYSYDIDNIVIDGAKYEDQIRVYIQSFEELQYGDRVQLLCTLEAPEPIEDFAFDRFLAARRIHKTCFSYYLPEVIETGDTSRLSLAIHQFHDGTLSIIQNQFSPPHSDLLAGLLMGDKLFSDEWEERFRQTGTSHLVAASGYNVSVVILFLFHFMSALGIIRYRAFTFLFGGVIAYVILAGADAAVIRAGVMGILLLCSRQIGRRADMLNVLILTACILLFLNPMYLRDDIGFQLSMISTIALIYLSPKVEKFFIFIPKVLFLRESFVSTTVATFATAPIIYFTFHQLSPIAILTNFLVLPFIPYIMLLGVLSIISNPLPLFTYPTFMLLDAVLFIIRHMSTISFL